MPSKTGSRKADFPPDEAWSPPMYARYLGTSPDQITGFIHSGELDAINTAVNPNGRPRWKITPEARAKFEASRRNQASKSTPRHSRRSKPAGVVKEFFILLLLVSGVSPAQSNATDPGQVDWPAEGPQPYANGGAQLWIGQDSQEDHRPIFIATDWSERQCCTVSFESQPQAY